MELKAAKPTSLRNIDSRPLYLYIFFSNYFPRDTGLFPGLPDEVLRINIFRAT